MHSICTIDIWQILQITTDVTYDDSHIGDMHLQKNMWDVTQLTLIDRHQQFGETCCLHLQFSALQRTRHCIPDDSKHSTSYRRENMKSHTEENFNHKNKDYYLDKMT